MKKREINGSRYDERFMLIVEKINPKHQTEVGLRERPEASISIPGNKKILDKDSGIW